LGQVIELLDDASPLVRAMAVWALRQLATPQQAGEYRATYYASEADADVRAEWE